MYMYLSRAPTLCMVANMATHTTLDQSIPSHPFESINANLESVKVCYIVTAVDKIKHNAHMYISTPSSANARS